MGGADKWIAALSRQFQSVRTTGVGVIQPVVDPAAYDELTKLTNLYIAERVDMPSQVAIAGKLGEVAQVLITWGVQGLRETIAGLRIPVVAVSHSPPERAGAEASLADAVEGAHYLSAVSHATRLTYPAQVRSAVKVIPGGIDVDRLAPCLGRDDWRQLWQIEPDEKIVLMVGRLAAEKHALGVAAAIAYLPNEWRGVFLGRTESSAEERIKTLIRQLAGERRVLFPPLTNRLGDWHVAADVAVAPAEYDGFGAPLIESWLAGTPLVAAQTTLYREFRIQHSDLAIPVMVRAEARDLADAILTAAAEGRDAPIVQQARRIAWQHYSAAAMAHRWEAYLAEILRDWQEHSVYPRLGS